MPAASVIKGWKAKIFTNISGAYLQVGFAESASVDIDSPVDEYLAVGYFQPVAIAEGARVLSGTLSNAWLTNDYIKAVYGDPQGAQAKWSIYFMRNETGYLYYIWAYDCLIETLSLDIPSDGFIKEDIDFRATYFYYGSL